MKRWRGTDEKGASPQRLLSEAFKYQWVIVVLSTCLHCCVGNQADIWGFWPGARLWHPDCRRRRGGGRPEDHLPCVSDSFSFDLCAFPILYRLSLGFWSQPSPAIHLHFYHLRSCNRVLCLASSRCCFSCISLWLAPHFSLSFYPSSLLSLYCFNATWCSSPWKIDIWPWYQSSPFSVLRTRLQQFDGSHC